MEIDFSAVDDAQDYTNVPEGVYACRVAEVRPGWTQGGDSRWALKLEITAGPFAGRTAAWDGITWGDRGLRRTKFVLGKFGFDTAGRLNVEPNDLVGCTAYVELRQEERIDPSNGVRTIRMRVPFLGYASDPTSLAAG